MNPREAFRSLEQTRKRRNAQIVGSLVLVACYGGLPGASETSGLGGTGSSDAASSAGTNPVGDSSSASSTASGADSTSEPNTNSTTDDEGTSSTGSASSGELVDGSTTDASSTGEVCVGCFEALPAGWTILVEREFGALEASDNVGTIEWTPGPTTNVSIVEDDTEPVSPPTVVQCDVPAGQYCHLGMGEVPELRAFYLGFTYRRVSGLAETERVRMFRVDSNPFQVQHWHFETTGTGADTRLFVGMYSTEDGGWWSLGGGNYTGSATFEYALTPDVWHTLEFLVEVPEGPGNADVQIWANGDQVFDGTMGPMAGVPQNWFTFENYGHSLSAPSQWWYGHVVFATPP